MCGIAGIHDAQSREEKSLAAMLRLIRHRGPDDEGTWHGPPWRLGMRRLSIIDVANGHQPMLSADGAWVIILNGEIYNHRTLREQLALAGTRFRTTSDTEVLLETIAQRGVTAALGSVEGMFAFAAVHIPSGDLWLARDRFGEKPLFIDRRAQRFAFCSELWPLLETSDAPRVLDADGITGLLRYGFPRAGTTAVTGITELLPAHWLRRSAGGSEETACYWFPPDRVDAQCGTMEVCGERLLELLDASVSDRLVADVPLGLFLSGGIDSAAVASSAVRSRPDIHAVTVGYENEAYDERVLARSTANQLGIVLEEELGVITPYGREFFDQLLGHYGEPFMDTSAVPTRSISRAARQRFKVVLSGDGGDELLGGYLSHKRLLRWQQLGFGRAGSAASALISRMLKPSGATEKFHRAFTLNAAMADGLFLHALEGVFTDEQVTALTQGTPWEVTTAHTIEDARESSRSLWNSADDPLLSLSLQHIRGVMPQDILMKVDRMSMAESLEVRAPFLDSKFAEYALSLPAHMKIKDGLGKFVLRNALRDRLPEAVLKAPKRGFAMPVRQWLGREFWADLDAELNLYQRDRDAELNVAALTAQIAADKNSCSKRNDFRALHRSVLLYSFLRWRRWFLKDARLSA